MMKELAIAVLCVNGFLIAIWTWRALRFTRAYNAHMAGKTHTIYTASILVGHPAAGRGVAWLIKDGYKECPSTALVEEGRSLRRLTLMTGLISLTIPPMAILWLQGAT